MRLAARWQRLRKTLAIHGAWKTLAIALDWAVNRLLVLDGFVVVILDREKLHRPQIVDQKPVTFRLATLEDLQALHGQPGLLIDDERLRAFADGDACLLQFVGDELAGYTWVHARGTPLLVPGLRIGIPGSLLYNYASLTLPAFRGRNHQSLRHHELLQLPAWQDRAGLLGYVRHANFSSRAGLRKSGYRELGRIWLAGLGDRVLAWIPAELRALGITRVDAKQEPQDALRRAITEVVEGGELPGLQEPNTAGRNVVVPETPAAPRPAPRPEAGR
jgi:hypothetical protein